MTKVFCDVCGEECSPKPRAVSQLADQYELDGTGFSFNLYWWYKSGPVDLCVGCQKKKLGMALEGREW